MLVFMLGTTAAAIWRARDVRALLSFLGLFAVVGVVVWLHEGNPPDWVSIPVAAATIILVVTLLVWFTRAAIRYWEYPYMKLFAAFVVTAIVSVVIADGEEKAVAAAGFAATIMFFASGIIIALLEIKHDREISELKRALSELQEKEAGR